MKIIMNGLLLIIFTFNISTAYSCSRPPGMPTVEEAYNKSINVYLAFAKTIKNHEKRNERGYEYFSQEIDFEVLEVWKGNKRVGEKVKYINDLSNTCLVSVTNDPPWLEEEPSEKSGSNRPVYVRMSGIWLIYEYSENIYGLERSGRTAPLEYGGAIDLPDLYVLSGKLKR